VSGAKYATTTEYVFNGDTLLSTVDQQTASGVATGTAQVRYIHPDHLGSTNVVTDQNGNLSQVLDYYPYGATRISVATSTNERRQYIGQFTDSSNLSYLNARYYNSSQGQFLTEDPVFWSKQNLYDPQSFNTYSYAGDNPIVKKDPSGKCFEDGCVLEAAATFGFVGGIGAQAFHDYSTGDFQRRSIAQNISTYALAGVGGAAVAAGGAAAGVAAGAAELGGLLTYGAVGVTTAGLTAGTEVGNNYLLGKPTNYGELGTDSLVAGLTVGTLTLLPGTQGALPQSLKTAINIFTRTHAARWGAESLVGTSMGTLGSAIYQSVGQGGASSNFHISTQAGGGSTMTANTSVSSASTWMGSFNPFAPHK